MQVNTQIIKKRFEKAMDKYNCNAVVQTHMAHRLIETLSRYGINFDKILELGAGTGLLTKEAVTHLYYKTYYANDLVDKSKYYLDKILPAYTFISGNAQEIMPVEKMNLIISNAMFQWFTDIDFTHFANLLEQGGLLAFTTFSPSNFKEIREVTGLSLDYKSTAQIRKAMHLNFEILYIEEYNKILNFKSVLELLAHMKNTGVNALSSHGMTYKSVKDLCDKYTEKFGNISLTYSPVIIIGKKSA